MFAKQNTKYTKNTKNSAISVGIIGPSGRNGKILRISQTIYDNMIQTAKKRIEELQKEYQHITLISGGAALSDHIAVELYIQGTGNDLILHLPCEWSEKNCQFTDYQKSINDFFGGSRKKTVAQKANEYHNGFSTHLDKTSLEEIQLALDKGAQRKTSRGFYARNAQIAKNSDILLAFSFGTTVEGGTKNTWDQFDKEKEIITIV